MLAAFRAEFFEREFFFDFFLIAGGMIIHFLAHIAFEFDEIFLRHVGNWSLVIGN